MNESEWLSVRQAAYDALIVEAGKTDADYAWRTSADAFDLHDEIVAKLDKLPREQGGRA